MLFMKIRLWKQYFTDIWTKLYNKEKKEFSLMNIRTLFKSLNCKIKPTEYWDCLQKKVNNFIDFANTLVNFILSQHAETLAHK